MPGQISAAEILALLRDSIEGDCRSEVHDDARPAVLLESRDAVHDSVRAHLSRIVVQDFQTAVGLGGHENRFAVEISARHAGERRIERGHHARDNDAVDVLERQIAEIEQVAEENSPFVGSLIVDRAQPPVAEPDESHRTPRS